jgi:hypothetical protein
MSKWKSFLAGVVFGMMTAAAGAVFAAESDAVLVNALDAVLWWDGVRVADEGRDDTAGSDLPALLEYQGVPYVSLPLLAGKLGADWSWDRNSGLIDVTRASRLTFQRPESGATEELPEEIASWVERSRDYEMVQSRTLDGVTWILATWGKKNTGGYDVHIDRIEREDRRLKVYVTLNGPDKGELVTEALTWPYALAAVEGTFEEVEFAVSGDGSLPELRGVESIPLVAASSERVIVFAPTLEKGELRLQGAARSFGGVVVLEVRDAADGLMLQERLPAAAEAPDWGYFETAIPADYVREGHRVVLYAFGDEELDPAREFPETEDDSAAARTPPETEPDASDAERLPEHSVVLNW